MTFRIDGTGEAPRAGEVATVYPALDEATRSLRCRVVVPNEPAALAPGSLVQVEAVVRTIEEALVVPRAALERDGSGWVLTVERGGARERRTVEVGLVTADEAQILSGVEPGDRVLVRTVG